MKKEINFKLFISCLEEFWEAIEVRFYGISSSIFFYVIVYLFFHPPWMKPLIDFFISSNDLFKQYTKVENSYIE